MEMNGVVNGNTITLDCPDALLPTGMRVRVRFEPVSESVEPPPTVEVGLRPDGTPMTFGDYFGDLIVDCPDLPTDLAAQHDHYRLGTPKR